MRLVSRPHAASRAHAARRRCREDPRHGRAQDQDRSARRLHVSTAAPRSVPTIWVPDPATRICGRSSPTHALGRIRTMVRMACMLSPQLPTRLWLQALRQPPGATARPALPRTRRGAGIKARAARGPHHADRELDDAITTRLGPPDAPPSHHPGVGALTALTTIVVLGPSAASTTEARGELCRSWPGPARSANKYHLGRSPSRAAHSALRLGRPPHTPPDGSRLQRPTALGPSAGRRKPKSPSPAAPRAAVHYAARSD